MAHRIEIAFRPEFVDAQGNSVKKRIFEDLKIAVEAVKTVDVYTIDADLSEKQLEILCENLFADPIIQIYSYRKLPAKGSDWIIEVGFHPGVTDNAGKTSKEAIEDILKRKIGGVYTSKQYRIKGKIAREDAKRIARELLANDLVERWDVKSASEFEESREIHLPIVRLEHNPKVEEIDLNISEEKLMKISKERLLALSVEEMKTIGDYFNSSKVIRERTFHSLGSKPTDVELECLAQTWSEHCKHKIFNALITYKEGGNTEIIDSLFDNYIKRSTDEIGKKTNMLVSVFKDNAGVIKFNNEWNLVMKVETHNSPSALEPYGGALTGIVGVNRDPMGTGRGAKLVFNTNVFCFASPFYKGKIPPRLIHPKRIFEGVRRGVEHGGNKSGIPTVNGSLVFHERFLGKPLVYCGTGAMMPAKINGEESHRKIINRGDLIVMLGGRIGKDGIHGATFSSEELHEGSPATAVQIGDPITQKRMLDFILEARDLKLFKAITDNGAGGLSSSIGETAQLSGGCEIHLEKCPLKYAGLDPWEILLSESQERMTIAVAPDKIDEFTDLAKRRDVEATSIGKYTSSGKFHVFYDGETVAYLDMDFLHNGLPQMKLNAKWEERHHLEPEIEKNNFTEVLKEMLSRLNICSKEYVVRQYDHEQQGGSVVKPLMGAENDGPSDAAVIRPLLNSIEGIVVSHGICPKYSDIDSYHMAACAIDEAVRNAVAVGGNLHHMAGLDNFCWCDPVKSEKTPDGEYKLAQLVRANKALYDYTTIFGIPCISGKDSMKNDYHIGETKISIPPTLLFTAISRIGDARKAVTMDAKKPSDVVFILGITKDELGGSEYYDMHGYLGKNVPKVDFEKAKKLYIALSRAMNLGLVASCHDCSDGGLAVALAETSFSGNLGMEIDISRVPIEHEMSNEKILFSETPSRFIVTVPINHVNEFEKIIHGNTFNRIGYVTANKEFLIKDRDKHVIIEADIDDLKESWKKTLAW